MNSNLAICPDLSISVLQRLGLRDPTWHLRPRKRFKLTLEKAIKVALPGALIAGASAYSAVTSVAHGTDRPIIKVVLDTITHTILDRPAAWVIEGPASAPLIAIDAGHGGKDAGAVRDNKREKDLALAASLELREALLQRGGVRVVLTRADDSTSTPASRAAALSSLNPDVVISVHLDSFPDSAISGPSVFLLSAGEDRNAAESSALARTMLKKLYAVQKGPLNNPGRERLAILRVPGAANILVELGYLTNPADRARMAHPSTRQPYIAALAQGVGEHLRKPPAQQLVANNITATARPVS